MIPKTRQALERSYKRCGKAFVKTPAEIIIEEVRELIRLLGEL